jgi:hypothetical protein
VFVWFAGDGRVMVVWLCLFGLLVMVE